MRTPIALLCLALGACQATRSDAPVKVAEYDRPFMAFAECAYAAGQRSMPAGANMQFEPLPTQGRATIVVGNGPATAIIIDFRALSPERTQVEYRVVKGAVVDWLGRAEAGFVLPCV